uniref:Uncharacterized protein n=1 Tax=Downy mildew lesion associated orfanplasmovirus 7 TaxID=3070633 RepID=A0AA51U9E5_9VIRU|nr:MAG: hypothetical protein [Plasmopara viticola lesion associated orfanplasmovirus 7]
MGGIAASLEFQQTPSIRLVNWQVLNNRAVLALEGGTPGDLDFRFKMNSILRSTRKATSKLAVLRASKKSTLGFTDTREIPVSDLEGLLTTLPESREDIRKDIYQLCKEHDRGIPARYLGAESSEEEKPFVAVEAPIGVTRRKLAFTAIQRDQEFKKRLSELEAEWHRSIITQQLVERTLENHRSTFQRRLSDAKKSYSNSSVPFEESPQAKHLWAHATMPKLTAPVVGIHVRYHSSMDILQDDYVRLASFCDRHPDQTLWYAPDQAVTDAGPQPLSPAAEKLLLKHVHSRKLDLKSLDKQGREAQAWRWLIISHNHVYRLNRVKLHPKLSIAYERNQGRKPAATPQPSAMDPNFLGAISSLVDTLTKTAENREAKVKAEPTEPVLPEQVVLTFLGTLWETAKWFSSTYADADSNDYRLKVKPGKDQFKHCVAKWNTLFSDADQMMEGKEIQVRDLDNEPPNLEAVRTYLDTYQGEPADPALSDGELDFEWEKEHPFVADDDEGNPLHPESFDKDGLTFFRCDIDFIDVTEGQVYVTTVYNGIEYHAVTAELPGKSASKGKGKVAQGIPVPPPVPGNKPKAPRSKTGKEDRPPPGPVVARENPLHIKGEPKSKALSEEQRSTLRKFFKLEEGLIPADEWRTLSSKEKADALTRRSIPKWAVEAVLRSHANLQLILEGKLSKGSLSTSKGIPRSARTKSSSAALEAWLQLKSDFKGVSLLRKPVTGREKAFKKRFDQLVADYGEQTCFPKLKERPDQQGRPSSSRGSRSQSGDMNGFVDMAKAFGEIARAFSGK